MGKRGKGDGEGINIWLIEMSEKNKKGTKSGTVRSQGMCASGGNASGEVNRKRNRYRVKS